MVALYYLIPLFSLIYLFYGRNNFKRFLLLSALLSMPFRSTYTIFAPVNVYQGWTNGISLSVCDCLLIILYVYCVINNKFNRNVSIRLLIPIYCFIGAALISCINSTWPIMSILQIIMMVQITFLYYYIIANSIENFDDLNAIINFTMVFLIFQGLLSIAQYITEEPFDFFSTGPSRNSLLILDSVAGLKRAFGTVGKPNAFAAYLLPLLCVNIAYIFSNNKFKKLRIFSVIIGTIALILSFSRGSWIGFSFALIIFLIIGVKKRIISVSRLFQVFFVAGILSVGLLGMIHKRIEGEDGNSAMSRIPLIKIAINMIKAHPIAGVGVNTSRSVIHNYTITPDLQFVYLQQVHNQYLLVFAEMGIIGVLTFLWLCIRFFREGSLLANDDTNENISFMSIGIRVGFISIACHMMVDLFNSYLLIANSFFLAALLSAGRNLVEKKLTYSNEISS